MNTSSRQLIACKLLAYLSSDFTYIHIRVLFSGGGGAEGKLLPQTLFLPPQNKYHLATPFPVLKARAWSTHTAHARKRTNPILRDLHQWLKTSLYVRMLCILIVVYAVVV